jgi:DNA polymerase III subunit epsilon
MKLNLDRDLVVFDVETTGLNVIRDRILQIGLIKIHKNGAPDEELEMLINPSIPISEESMSIHGITPKDLVNKPTFVEIGQKIYDFIGDSDLAGYNHARFDVPMLMEEFARIGLNFDLSKRRLIDVQRIFYKMEPRNLKAAYRLYVGGEMESAHDALADVKATLAVFKGQLTRYEGQNLIDDDGNVIETPIKNDMESLHLFTNDLNFIDATQKLRRQPDGSVIFTFGKYANQKMDDVWRQEKNYFNWILEKEFSVQVKQFIRDFVQSKK